MTATVPSVVDVVGSVTQSSLVPDQEYLLQGSVLDSAREVLMHRLQGLCDSGPGGPEPFNELELVYTLYPPSPVPGQPPNAGQPLTMRVRRPLGDGVTDLNNTPWMLRYAGNPEMGDQKRPTIIRNCLDVACSPNITEFLNELGFKLDYEFVAKGHMFRKGRMKVTVCKIFRISTTPNKSPPETNFEAISGSHLVELSVATSRGQQIDNQLGEDIKSFAEQLKPLVQLMKVDPRRIPLTE